MKRLDGRDPAAVRAAAALVAAGGLVVFPTETVYGVAALGLDARAVDAMYQAKGRPRAAPLTLMVRSLDEGAPLWRDGPAKQRALALGRRLWPGPLTIVAPRARGVPDVVVAGGDEVGVRVPDHAIARAFLVAIGAPIVAPSANRSGEPAPTSADDAAKALGDVVAAVLDGGPCALGVPSTVVDVSGDQPRILRAGAVTLDEIAAVIGGA